MYTYQELCDTLIKARDVIKHQEELIAKNAELIALLKEMIALNDRELAATRATIMQSSLN